MNRFKTCTRLAPKQRRLSHETLECRRVLAAAINVGVRIDDVVAENAPGPRVPENSAFEKRVVITNTGNAPVTNLIVTDDGGTPADPTDDIYLTPILDDPLPTTPLGTVAQTFDVGGIQRFVRHPFSPRIYGISGEDGTVTVFNTDTLTIQATVSVGTEPRGLAISDDGTRLYVSVENEIAVLQTSNNQLLASLAHDNIHDLATGPDGDLYAHWENPSAGRSDEVRRIDTTTGDVVGTNISVSEIDQIVVSPAKDRLYVANYGLSPASLFQFDLTVDPPNELWTSSDVNFIGSNGQDLAISDDGSFVSFVTGSGQDLYTIAKFRTSDMLAHGSFDTGAFPREITFSPNHNIAYTVNNGDQIKTWDTTTYIEGDEINTSGPAGEAQELLVDRTGKYVFAAFGDEVVAYSTGQERAPNVGDINGDGLMNPGEIWSFRTQQFSDPGANASQITATVIDTTGDQVSQQVASHYFGSDPIVIPKTTSVVVSSFINDQNASFSPGPELDVGDVLNRVVGVTSTGNQAVLAVNSVVDDAGTPNDLSDDIVFQPEFQSDTSSDFGTVEATFDIQNVSDFARHPIQPLLYVISDRTNLLTIINTTSLTIESEFPIGSNPRSIAISDDGTRLFIATAPEIVVLNTATNAMQRSLPYPRIRDIAAGQNGFLFAASDDPERSFADVVRKIDTTSGDLLETFGVSFGDQIAISPDKDRLYVVSHGISPASLQQYDVSVEPANLLWESSDVSEIGSNGQDLAVSNDGSFVSFATGSGQRNDGPYWVSKFQTSDMATVGQFNVGAFPREVVYGKDDEVVFTVNDRDEIKSWNAFTFEAGPEIDTSGIDGEANELFLDQQFQYLFAAFSDRLVVYSTGESQLYNIGDTDIDGILDSDETWRFTALDTAVNEPNETTITVNVVDQRDLEFDTTATSHYSIAPVITNPQLSIASTIDGAVIDSPPGPDILVGNVVSRTYSVANTGDVAFTNLVVVDDSGTDTETNDDFQPTFVSGDVNQNDLLDPGETWQFESTTIAAFGSQTLQTSVTGQEADGSGDLIPDKPTASATDTSYYRGRNAITNPIINLSTTIDNLAANQAPGPALLVGDQVPRRYVLTNPGDVAFANVVVTDDAGTAADTSDDVQPILVSGDVDSDRLFDPGEIWVFETVVIVVEQQNTLVTTASGQEVDADGNIVPDEPAFTTNETTHYIGQSAGISLNVYSNDVVDNSSSPPLFSGGQFANWIVDVQNIGDSGIRPPEIYDDLGDSAQNINATEVLIANSNIGDANNNGLIDPDESWRYVIIRRTEPGLNVGTVVAKAVTVTDIQVDKSFDRQFLGFQETALAESVSGAAIAEGIQSDGVDFSDDRFELTDGKIQLKPQAHLTYAEDNGILVTVADQITGDILLVFEINVAENPLPWQNAITATDTNDDGSITARDALAIINELNRTGERELLIRHVSNTFFFDTNGDKRLSALDALIVINDLDRRTSEGESEQVISGFFSSPVEPESDQTFAENTPNVDQVISKWVTVSNHEQVSQTAIANLVDSDAEKDSVAPESRFDQFDIDAVLTEF